MRIGLATMVLVVLLVFQADAQRQRRPRQNRSDAGAPKVGDQAPDFKVKSLDGKSEFDLAAAKGTKPIVLIFGSYT